MEVARQKLLIRSQALLQRHEREIKGIKKKHQTQRDDLLKQREKEFEIVEQRFINVWNEMDGKYRKELINMDKFSVVKKMQMKAKNRLPAVFC